MWRAILLACLPFGALACGRPVCLLPAGSLAFDRLLTFDGTPATMGPGHPVAGLLRLPGASFGKLFAGQVQGADGLFDTIGGPALPPPDLRAGPAGRNLSVLRVFGAALLSGNGPSGYPRDDSTGEGAIAIRLHRPQAALALDLVGGEGGAAEVLFLGPEGQVLDLHRIAPLGEGWLTFQVSAGQPPILGLVITNHDDAGIALRAVALDGDDRTS